MIKLIKYPSAYLLLVGLLSSLTNWAQVTGGQHAFSFLEIANQPHVAALGSISPVGNKEDVGFALQNPAFLNPRMHNQLALNYNLYYADIGIADLQYAYHVDSLKTDFSFGVQYLNYGNFEGTDVYGNLLGTVHAADYSVHLSASRHYLEHWRYGVNLKFAHSRLADRRASALLADVGVMYEDTARLFTLGVVAKNMGVMVQRYNPQERAEPLPFDLQLGFAKQLRNVPITLYMVGHHLYQWDVRYDNPADIKNQNILGAVDTNKKEGSHFADKLFRHINIGAEIVIGKRVTLSGAYNHLHRAELGTDEVKGLAGFSFGAGIHLNKLDVQYARSNYGTAGAFNQLGLVLKLNKLFSIGSKTEKWGWNKTY